MLRALPRERISYAVGRLCEHPLPPVLSGMLSRAYGAAFRVDMADVAAPHGTYRSFDAFFTRPLRSGARSVGATPVVCPSDGRMTSHGPIDDGARIFVKGRPYEVRDLLGNSADAPAFAGGSHAVIYLSPRDYHRVHSPVDGQLCHVRAIPGDLYPVNRIGERCTPRLLVQNRRVSLSLQTTDGQRIALVMVGAFVVGKITVNVLGAEDVGRGSYPIEPRVAVRRGDEIGAFHLGSTVVLLLPPGWRVRGGERRVQLGEPLAEPVS